MSLHQIIQKRKKKHNNVDNMPIGLTLDSRNYSCAFDAVLIILYHMWKESDGVWRNTIYTYGEYMQELFNGFKDVNLENCSLDQVRNNLHIMLNRTNSNIFPFGHHFTDITELSAYIMEYGNCGGSYKLCSVCGNEDSDINVYFDQVTPLMRISSHDQPSCQIH